MKAKYSVLLAAVLTGIFPVFNIKAAFWGWNVDKFDWLPTESAPVGYPMRIIKGDLIFEDGQSIYIPDGKAFQNGLGKGLSTHVVGAKLKPIPQQLRITWFSYTENLFYSGQFKLPFERITELFKNSNRVRGSGQKVVFDGIVVGMAPGGFIYVWLIGPEGVATEVATFQAAVSEVPFTAVSRNPELTRDDIIRRTLADELSPEAIEKIKKEGVPTKIWPQYSHKVSWRPRLETEGQLRYFRYRAVNGEFEWVNVQERGVEANIRALPLVIEAFWHTLATGSRRVVIINLDPEEVLAAFEKFSTSPVKAPLELKVDPSETSNAANVYLTDSVLIYHFEKTKVKIFVYDYPKD